jgi:ribosomal protein S18 acetylase RimI-like enzyme
VNAATLTRSTRPGYTGGMPESRCTIREMTIDDYGAVVELWRSTAGIGLSEADSRDNVASFLRHNPGLSFVALADGRLAGAMLGSQDGRRGYLHHLAVSPGRRRLGIGRQLVERSLAAMGALGLRKCHIFVFADNAEGRRFWKRIGWVEREELLIMSHDIPAGPAAGAR